MKNRVIETLQTDNVFLTGSAGVGKSYLVKEIIDEYKRTNKNIVTLGSTGVSAVGIGGQTLHSFFKFGISNSLEELRGVKVNKQSLKELNEILTHCDLLIIDEISMVGASLLDMIRYRLSGSRFNGTILFVGDFFQLPPVHKKESLGLFEEPYYAFESASWDYFDPKVVQLTKSKRTDDTLFFHMLSQIRKGLKDDEILNYLQSLTQNRHLLEDEPTVLYGRNLEANNRNRQKLDEIKGELMLLSGEEVVHKKGLMEQRVKSWKNNLPVSDVIELKVGAKVLFCVNKWNKFANGETGVVKRVESGAVVVQKDDGREVAVEKHEFVLNDLASEGDNIEEVKLASFSQFPLKLAYAITIHKSQGMSIEKLICDIDNIFEFSQFYVAISRAKNPKNLLIASRNGDLRRQLQRCIKIDERVKSFYENQKYIHVEE